MTVTRNEHFNSFLSVAISLGNEKIGVLVVQHEQKDYFNQNDVMALRAIASQLAGTVANARLMMTSHRSGKTADKTALLENLRFIKKKGKQYGHHQIF